MQRVRKHFLEQGEVGLADRREDNGDTKVMDDFLRDLYASLNAARQTTTIPHRRESENYWSTE